MSSVGSRRWWGYTTSQNAASWSNNLPSKGPHAWIHMRLNSADPGYVDFARNLKLALEDVASDSRYQQVVVVFMASYDRRRRNSCPEKLGAIKAIETMLVRYQPTVQVEPIVQVEPTATESFSRNGFTGAARELNRHTSEDKIKTFARQLHQAGFDPNVLTIQELIGHLVQAMWQYAHSPLPRMVYLS